jgi:hypothetical protein
MFLDEVDMNLKEALDDKKFDVRLRDRLVAEGKITQQELETFKKSLNDDEDNSSTIQIDDSRYFKN